MASLSSAIFSPPISTSSSPLQPNNKNASALAAFFHHSPLSCSKPAFSPLTSSANCRGLKIVAMATSETSDPSAAVQDLLKSIQETWDKTDDKLAVGGLGFTAVIVLWASFGLLGAIDKLPLLPNLFELVGILFTGWFIYRNLLFKPDREEFSKNIETTVAKITGTGANEE